MKKTIKSFLLGLVLLLGLALTSCQMPGGTACTHQAGASWEASATEHWHICDLCQKQVDTEAHAYGEWVLQVPASVGYEGLETRSCSVCKFYEQRTIPAIVVETGVAAEEMAVYAKVPADWTVANCYYWGDEIDGSQTVGWPGKEMTLVDAEQNIWGFIVPVGTANVIFNNGSGVQTADLVFALSLNLYELTELNAEGKYIANYATHEPAADEPELNKYPVSAAETFRTIYVQLPLSWTNHLIHSWGAISTPAWPGVEMDVVDAEKGIYSFELSSKITGIIFNNKVGDEGVQTADIIPNEAINGYIVSEDGSYVERVYENGAFAEEKVTYYAQLPAGWTGHYAYWWGTSDAPAAWPGVEMTLVDEAQNIYSVEVVKSVAVIIFGEGEGKDQTVNISIPAGANAFVVVPQSGNDAAEPYTYADGALTPFVPAEPIIIDLYLRGDMNGWGTADQLAYADGVYSITAEIAEGQGFKIADAGWAVEIHYNMLQGVDATLFGPNSDAKPNIMCLVGGTYIITVYNAGTADAYATIVAA